MKKIYFFSSIALLLLALSSSKQSRTTAPKVILTVDGTAPNLPSQPFDYQFHLPKHLTGERFDSVGYETSNPDTTLIPLISNEGATLGRVLFYDEKLSALENISCASCHLQSASFADNKAFSQGVNTLTSRNSMALNDIGWTNNNTFFWDFRGADLHSAIELPLTDDNEIGANMEEVAEKLENTSYYPALFENAFGSSEITEAKIIDALVQFMASITSFNTRFDEGSINDFSNFSASELRGKNLFANNCSFCHKEGSQFTFFGDIFFNPNEEFEMIFENFGFLFANGLEEQPSDPGLGGWLGEHFTGLYKVPTLRNIELTGPYMHDGRFSNLDEVIEHYSSGIVQNDWTFSIPIGGFNFAEQEKTDLKNFLLTLTDHSLQSEEKWSDPFATPLGTEELQIEVSVQPNPMDYYSEIILTDNHQRVDVYIMDASGRLLKRDYFTEDRYVIEKGSFTTGVYFVQLLRGHESTSIKLLVK
jgi:cytochrome c peroxidase